MEVISLAVILLIFPLIPSIRSDELPTCQPKDFEYSFTECDEFQGRWRVSVPKEPGTCTGGNPNAPVRVRTCFTACSSGSFYNPSTLICDPCPPGSYSLGGGIKVTHFNSSTLEKNGISIKTQSSDSLTSRIADETCDDGWKMKPSGILEVKPSAISESTCKSVVGMNVRIVKNGNIRFTYQYVPSATEFLLFTFHHRNNEDVTLKNSYSDISDIDSFDINFLRETAGYSSSRWSQFDLPLEPGYHSLLWRSVLFGSKISRDMFDNISSGRQRTSSYDAIQSEGPSSSPTSTTTSGLIRIKSIEIYGTAFASDCTLCDEGFYSNITGSKNCLPCPVNTFNSAKGSVTCSPCDPTTSYSPLASTSCIKRPICGMDDVYLIKSNCVENKQKTSYEWIKPKICHDVNNLISRLGSKMVPCNDSSTLKNRDCSPGMELLNGKCSLCPAYNYNDGSLARCKQCPPSSLPLYNLVLNTWKNDLNLKGYNLLAFDCYSTLDPSATFSDCKTNVEPWKVIPSTEGSYIRSSEVPLDSIITMQLSIPGFRHSSGGKLTFTFSLIGPDSSLILSEMKGKMNRQIGSWITGRLSDASEGITEVKEDENIVFHHYVRENVPVSFTWVYQRSQLIQSHVNIYSISVTNSLVSGAISCSSCSSLNPVSNHDENRDGQIVDRENNEIKDRIRSGIRKSDEEELEEESKCIPCPSGRYLNIEGGEKRRNLVTFTSHHSSSPLIHPSENQSKIATVSNASDNTFTEKISRRKREIGRTFGHLNMVQLENAECLKCPPGFVINSTLSFPKGIKESCIKCGPGLISNLEGTDCIASCNNNLNIDGEEYNLAALKYPLSFQASHLFSASGMKYFHSFNISLCGSPIRNLCTNNASSSPKFYSYINPNGFIETASSLVCRSTMVPDGGEKFFSTQSVSLANTLKGISRESTFLDQKVVDQFSGIKSDLHFFFEPTSPTLSCKSGRSMIVTLRCDPTVPSDSPPIISAPTSCPLGTCDGCSFNLLIRANSSATCRKCKETDYDTVIGECINGIQNVHLINPKNCIIDINSKTSVLIRHCSILPKSVELFLIFISFFTIIMSVLLIHCWKKNQKLEYNYSKLVENKNTSESCMEDDDDEENGDSHARSDTTSINTMNEHQSLRQQIISSRNEIDYSGYETIQLTKHMQEDVC